MRPVLLSRAFVVSAAVAIVVAACSYGRLEYVRVAPPSKDGAKTFAQTNDVLRRMLEFAGPSTNCRDEQFLEVSYRHSDRIGVGVYLYVPEDEVFLLFSELGVRELSAEAKALLGRIVSELATSFGASAVQDSLRDDSLYKRVHAIVDGDWRSPLCRGR